jgi:hypothetical protein
MAALTRTRTNGIARIQYLLADDSSGGSAGMHRFRKKARKVCHKHAALTMPGRLCRSVCDECAAGAVAILAFTSAEMAPTPARAHRRW